jgi:DNA-binding NarL/FixJ family response regulator
MPVKILVADDHDIVRKGVLSILQSRPEWQVCCEASNGVEAVEGVKKFSPDITILDISMPEMDGVQAAFEIAHQNLHTRVLIFTMHYSKTLVQAVRNAGASGYVLKSNAAHELIRAIETLLQGDKFFGAGGRDSSQINQNQESPGRKPLLL